MTSMNCLTGLLRPALSGEFHQLPGIQGLLLDGSHRGTLVKDLSQAELARELSPELGLKGRDRSRRCATGLLISGSRSCVIPILSKIDTDDFQ